jgi:hypothetical protein
MEIEVALAALVVCAQTSHRQVLPAAIRQPLGTHDVLGQLETEFGDRMTDEAHLLLSAASAGHNRERREKAEATAV